ncbi:MAG: ATPase protein [Chitinophagaceae bacterium]|nr:ATPase protein [Chitinophagaceae bacterium]
MPSTVVASFSYDEITEMLRITFVSGLVYQYKSVPFEIYHAMKTSGAKGIYFNQHIKGKYEFEKLDKA